MAETWKPYDLALEGSASAETRDMHPTDRRIRGCGFIIHSRPRTGPTLWERGGAVITQPEVEAIVRREERERKARKEAG